MKLTKLSELIGSGEELKGRWEITPNHEIQYKKTGPDEEIKVRGSLVAVEPDALVIGVTKRQTDQTVVTSIYKLAGAWRLDLNNRIVFEVEREDGKKDALTFKGAWQVGRSYQLIYTYEETDLKRKRNTLRKITRELVFTGFWDISEENRLTYWLGAGSDSAFRFRGAFQTKSVLAKKGELRYQVGIEVVGEHRLKTIALFGKWKVSRNLDLSFEIEYADGRKRSITFGGEYAINKDTRIAVNLKNQTGKPLGIEVILTKDIFGKDGQAFVRLQRSLEESRVEAGMRIKW